MFSSENGGAFELALVNVDPVNFAYKNHAKRQRRISITSSSLTKHLEAPFVSGLGLHEQAYEDVQAIILILSART